MVTLANPFDFNSELAPAMGDPGSATAPDFTDPPVAVAVNSELTEGPVVAPRQTESFAARSPGPGCKKDQASIEPAPAPLPTLRAETTAGALLSFAPAAFSKNKTAAIAVWEKTSPKMAQAIREMPSDTYLPPKEWLPELFPENAPHTGETIVSVSSPAAFSLDVRIHNIMLAIADELADEQRTINERLLLQQFAPQSRHT